ncbi:hypothetical protein H8959_011607 [Pygathrix nigripes]
MPTGRGGPGPEEHLDAESQEPGMEREAKDFWLEPGLFGDAFNKGKKIGHRKCRLNGTLRQEQEKQMRNIRSTWEGARKGEQSKQQAGRYTALQGTQKSAIPDSESSSCPGRADGSCQKPGPGLVGFTGKLKFAPQLLIKQDIVSLLSNFVTRLCFPELLCGHGKDKVLKKLNQEALPV